MCGPAASVLGREIDSVIWRFRTGMPTRFPVAKGPVRLCGAILDADEESGKALAVRRYEEVIPEEVWTAQKGAPEGMGTAP